MDTLSTTAANILGAYPVVLAGIKDVAHLVSSDGVHVLIIAANFFPLEDRQQKTIDAVAITTVQKEKNEPCDSNSYFVLLELPSQELIIDVATHWNSSLLSPQKAAVTAAGSLT